VLANAMTEWFIPPLGPPTLRVVLLVILMAGVLVWVRPWSRRQAEAEGRSSPLAEWSVSLIAAGAHLGLLLITKALFSFQLSLGRRGLYPIALLLLLASIQYLGHRPPTRIDRRTRFGSAVLGLCCLLATGWIAVSALSTVASGGRGFNSDGFLQSDAVVYVVGSIPGDLVYSNVPDGLWAAGLAGARPIPTVFDPLSLADNELLDQELDRIAEAVEGGAVVFYYQEHERDYMVDEGRVRGIAPCVVVADATSIVLSAPDHPACTGE